MNWFYIGIVDDIPARGARCVATPQGRIHVEALQVALRHVEEEVASHVGPTLGVASGFNSMDGD